MKRYSLIFAALLLLNSGAMSQEPSATIAGWRGNWTGKFPNSTAPANWDRVSKLMVGVCVQAAKPKGESVAGTPANFGTIPEWLVLGPFVATNQADLKTAIDEEFIKEADIQPDLGEKAGEKVWQKVEGQGAYLNLEPVFEKPDVGWVAYAHTYVYSEQTGKAILRFLTLPAIDVKAWVNGKQVFLASKSPHSWQESQYGHKVDLVKGWNRILVKIVRGKPGQFYLSPWRFSFFFYAAAPYEWAEPKNIAWMTKIPGAGCIAGPVIAGEKIFTMSDPFDLVCVNKKNGKILWIRPVYFFDALTDEEKKNPAFQEVFPLVEQLKALNNTLCAQGITTEASSQKIDLEQKIINLLAKANPKQYSLRSGYPEGNWTPTPVTDGRNIYVWTALGVLACYDLDGNRQWSLVEKTKSVSEHGNNCSPILAAGRVIVFDDCAHNTIAFDTATGKEVWRQTEVDLCRQYPKVFSSQGVVKRINDHASPITFKIQNTDVVLIQNLIFRATDGKVLWYPESVNDLYHNLIMTPIVENGVIYSAGDGFASSQLILTQVPNTFETNGMVKLKRLGSFPIIHSKGDQHNGHLLCASPLCHDGLVYIIDMIGRMRVYDVKMQALLYEKNLGFPDHFAKVYLQGSCFTSPTLVGKNIIVSSSSGTWIVFEPGREFKLVAINRLENELPRTGAYRYSQHPEQFIASPVAEGKYLFIRGDENLYCIGAK